MPDLDNVLRSGLNLQPSPIVKLQPSPSAMATAFWKIKKDIFALICSQANPAAVARIEIESESACRLFLRPIPGGSMRWKRQ